MDAFNSFLETVTREIIDPIITLMALGAFVVFVWGVVKFIKNADNDEKRGEGKQHMLWGLVGLAIIFGAFAILNFMKGLVGVE
ncbi:MAG TPA: pilin [Candidatus Paceibacterota bacterium]|nr:pilin [Candidatus Paceibacterota bacterium]